MSQDVLEPAEPEPDGVAPEDSPPESDTEKTMQLAPVVPATAATDTRMSRRAGRRRKFPADNQAPWPEVVMMICLGALLMLGALSMAFPFNTPVQQMNRAGLIVSGAALAVTLGNTAAAVGWWCRGNMRSALACLVLVASAAINWCAWRFSFNLWEAIGSLL